MALAPGIASAEVTITGTPMTVIVGETGLLQANVAGSSSNVFYPPSSSVGDAGFAIGFQTAAGAVPADSVAGFQGNIEFTAVSQTDPVDGTGTAADPFKVVTVYKAEDGTPADVVIVTQTLTYVNGQRSFKVSYAVQNVSGGEIAYRASTGADLYLEGSDSGIGFLVLEAPRLVGGISPETGRAGGIQEITPWDGYQEAHFTEIYSKMGDPVGEGFNNTVNPNEVDNGVGVQWDAENVADDATRTFELAWQFGLAGLTLTPPTAVLAVGQTHSVSLAATDQNGNPLVGANLRYAVTGANPQQGAVTTGAGGAAAIGWVGQQAGEDVLTVFNDVNGNSVREPSEPVASATVTWLAPPLPENAFVFKGKSKLKRGKTILQMTFPGPGKLFAGQLTRKGDPVPKARRLMKPINKTIPKAGTFKVAVKPTKKGQKLLQRKGKITAMMNFAFTPTNGVVSNQVRSVKMVKPRRGGGKKFKRKKGNAKRSTACC